MEETIEIRWHGRGGQGVVTASEVLADAALLEGKSFQALPEFGAERSGAPIRAYTRLSTQPIAVHYAITHPDAVVVLDPTLIAAGDLSDGLKPGGLILINSPDDPDDVWRRLGSPAARVYTVDASAIARNAIGRNIPNVPMLGALLSLLPVVGVASLEHAIERRLGSRVAKHVVEGNLRALQEAAAAVRGTGVHPDAASVAHEEEPAVAAARWSHLVPGAVILNPGNSVEYETGSWRSERPVIDWKRCTHCMLCWVYCPDSCFHAGGGRLLSVDYDHCKGCGICAAQCPPKCIAMVPELEFQEA